METNDMMSTYETGRVLGLPQGYVIRLARKGQIEARKVGGFWFLSRHAVLKYKNEAREYEEYARDVNKEVSIIQELILNGFAMKRTITVGDEGQYQDGEKPPYTQGFQFDLPKADT